jgi:hypothetical protein
VKDKDMKCIVKNCLNNRYEGRFIGDLCSPCFEFIAKEKGIYSQAYRNIQQFVEKEREECAKWADLVAREIDNTNNTASYIASGIRAREEK